MDGFYLSFEDLENLGKELSSDLPHLLASNKISWRNYYYGHFYREELASYKIITIRPEGFGRIELYFTDSSREIEIAGIHHSKYISENKRMDIFRLYEKIYEKAYEFLKARSDAENITKAREWLNKNKKTD